MLVLLVVVFGGDAAAGTATRHSLLFVYGSLPAYEGLFTWMMLMPISYPDQWHLDVADCWDIQSVESSILSKDEAEVKGASNPNMSWLHEALRVAFIDVVETLKEGRVHIDYSKLVKADDNGKDEVLAPYRPEYQVAEEIKCHTYFWITFTLLVVDKLRKDKTQKMDVNAVHWSSQVFRRLLLPMNAKLFKVCLAISSVIDGNKVVLGVPETRVDDAKFQENDVYGIVFQLYCQLGLKLILV
ncbi:hypothetical protein C5167_043286 [Papaver somniferum]|uniref:Uncharacterized protein n=1 Tax=Papaver somniferum TaxID=3469 RepID=A0A4Y7L8C3_PAPSO|nr:hypothetical protein C5167_043286 [Papaver somniferum]